MTAASSLAGRGRALATLVAAAAVAASCGRPDAAPPPEQATADCRSPSYATDILVCGDPDLRALDHELAILWATVEAGPSVGPQQRQAQTAWFRQRSLCAFEADHAGCTEAAYRARIAELQRETTRP